MKRLFIAGVFLFLILIGTTLLKGNNNLKLESVISKNTKVNESLTFVKQNIQIKYSDIKGNYDFISNDLIHYKDKELKKMTRDVDYTRGSRKDHYHLLWSNNYMTTQFEKKVTEEVSPRDTQVDLISLTRGLYEFSKDMKMEEKSNSYVLTLDGSTNKKLYDFLNKVGLFYDFPDERSKIRMLITMTIDKKTMMTQIISFDIMDDTFTQIGKKQIKLTDITIKYSHVNSQEKELLIKDHK